VGFLSHILDDVIHPFGLGHGQPAPQQGRPAPAFTPPPSNSGGLQVSTAPNNQQIDVAPPPQRQLAPAIHFATPTAAPDLRVSAAPPQILIGTDGRPVQAGAPAPAAPPVDTRSLASKLWDQINVGDSDRSFHNPTPSADAAHESLVHQITHSGAANAGGSLLNNFTAIPSVIDAGRLGVDELTHNQPAIDNATTSLAKNLPRFLPIGAAEDFKNGFGQDIATAATAPFAEKAAKEQADYVRKMFNNNTGDPVHDSQVEAYASAVENSLLNQHLETAGIDQNTPEGTVIRKVAGHAGSTAANVIFMSQMGNAAAEKFLPPDAIPKIASESAAADETLNTAKDGLLRNMMNNSLKAGSANAAAGVAGVMGTDNPTAGDYLKAGVTGFAQGAAFPVALEGLAAAPKLIQYAHEHAPELQPANEIGAIGKNVLEPTPGEPSPNEANKQLQNELDNARGKSGQPVPAAPPDVQQVIDAARQAIKSGDINGANTLADSLPAKYATPLKAELSASPMPSDFLTSELDNSRGVAGQPKKTGVVDKQLQQIQDTKKQLVDSAVKEVMQGEKAKTDIQGQIRAAGGISASDHESLPTTLKNKNGLPMDEMAANLGFPDDQALMDAIDAQTAGNKPLTPSQAREQVVADLEAGKHPYSADYAKATAAEQARQDELALYPKGTRAQVKVNDKAPGAMSDAELASLAQQPEAQVRPAKPAAAPAGKDVIRNADAERTVLDQLQKGAGSDAILSDYQKATGTTLQQAVRDVNRVASEANIETGLGKNPLEGSVQLPQVQEGDWKQATLNARHVQYKEQEVGSQALESYKGLSTHDQLLLRNIEEKPVSEVAKGAEDPTAFKSAAKDLRTYFDTRHAYDTALGIDVGYRTNYIRHFFDKAAEGDQTPTGDEQVRGGGANKTPGYTKARTNEALVKSVQDALERDITGSSFNHAKLAYENGLNDAFPGKVANGEIPRSTNAGKYVQIDHPFGGDLSVPKDIAHEINSRVWHPNDSKALDRYDAVNRGLKYVKLSGGLFHAFTESGNFLGQQLTSGKIFTDPVATGRMFKIFFSDNAMKHEVTRMADEGVLDKAHLAGLTIRSDQILADVNIKGLDKSDPNALKGAGEKVTKYTGIQAMHDATFQREIPYAKLKIFEQKTAGLDPMKPEDLAIMRKQAESINNLFGGINREIHGIKPGTFKWLQRGLLATDFTEGKFKTLANALSDKGAGGTTARQAVAGKVLLFGLIATAGAAAAGGYTGKSKAQIAKDAAGNLIDPQFEMGGYKVGLPKTHVSEVVDALKPTNKTGKAWNASGLVSYAQNRSAALPSEAISLLSNKNYYGQPLYGTNTKKNGGGKISGEQAALNIAQTGLPIPFGQATNTVTGKQAPAAAAANIIGFKAKPNPDNTVSFQGVNTTMNDKQTEAYQNTLKANTDKITKQLTSSADFKALSPNDQASALSDLKSNITSATQRDFASKNSLGQFAPDFKGKDTKASTKEQDILSGSINPNSYFPSNNAGHNSDSAAVAAFKKSDSKITTIGDQTYYKTGTGEVKNKNTFDYQNDIKTADLSFSMDRAKAGDDYKSWTTAANQRLDQLQSMLNHYDPQTEPDKIDAIKKEAADLTDQMQKYNSYGGQFTKPPKGRKGASSNGISYKFFNPTSYEKSLRSLLDAARVS
jgi:hypothetical protein